MMLFPASFRAESLDLVTSAHNYHNLIREELDIRRLNNIQRWLWVAGSTVPPRPLHIHLVMGREVIIHESMDMHLVWTTGKIFIKPLPLFLLDPTVWKEFLCCQDPCTCMSQVVDIGGTVQYCERRELYRCALGFLYSYAALIRYESDFTLAKERHLLPGHISWFNWILFIRELDIEHIYPDINQRFHHRELRLSRLNYVYYITQGSLDGYAHRYNRYSDFFRSHLAWMTAATVYVAIVLTAMQVGLATGKLGENSLFQSASYGFTVFALLAPLLPENDRPEELANSADDSPSLAGSTRPEPFVSPGGQTVATPKVCARLSRESVRILRQWFDVHSDAPYPDDATKEALRRSTGLTKTQLTNWFANTRRRFKLTTRSHSMHAPVDIPNRPGTPFFDSYSRQRAMSPMRRWVDSPPEDEPVPISAITRAASANFSNPHAYDDICAPALYPSSLSSAGTSGGDSSSSAWSGSSATHQRLFRNRRRRKLAPRTLQHRKPSPFECTFCTETFRKKYDWQRHETSIHLALERWLCRDEEPQSLHPHSGKLCCIFCSQEDPDQDHIRSHNPSACQERIFIRKDNLRQHLRLVHQADFVPWSMGSWKETISEVRSRCGLCRVSFETWQARVEHLGEHFKMGHTMAEWEGDWGFDEPILKMVENAIPPYLISTERNSPFPFQGSNTAANSPCSAYELISLELMQVVENHIQETTLMPTDQVLQLEACRIIFASEALSTIDLFPHEFTSWLRDAIMSNHAITQQALFGPIRSRRQNRLPSLEIKGKRSLFEDCPFELELRKFVDLQQCSDRVDIWDVELQQEACNIIKRVKGPVAKQSYNKVSTWLISTILGSTDWLFGFRQRTNLVPNESQPQANQKQKQPVDRSIGDSDVIQSRFTSLQPNFQPDQVSISDHSHQVNNTIGEGFDDPIGLVTDSGADQLFWAEMSSYMLNDSNFHEWLGRELGRWVASTTSPRNPQSHVPTDDELRHQARWIAYGDDDPWNQTHADNPEWLRRFKDLVGISKGYTTS
ncbi:Ff.00g134530.m01.CDS01 [Fusarium sp. VM40]|nr:Ff.00g134530.m01.CDS01 [Fusarium sp. VM40]